MLQTHCGLPYTTVSFDKNYGRLLQHWRVTSHPGHLWCLATLTTTILAVSTIVVPRCLCSFNHVHGTLHNVSPRMRSLEQIAIILEMCFRIRLGKGRVQDCSKVH